MIKMFQTEIESLKQENQQLREQSDKRFEEQMSNYNQKVINMDSQMKECSHLKEQNAKLSGQISQLKEENDDILLKLTNQDEIQIKLDQVTEELEKEREDHESTKKSLDYFQNDMLPSLEKQFHDAKAHTQELRNENARLMIENRNFKGSIEDKLKHYEDENIKLKNEKAEADVQSQFAMNENKDLREKIESINNSLNLKTQELLMKQEALDGANDQMVELKEQLNDKDNLLNSNKENIQVLEQNINELSSSKE